MFLSTKGLIFDYFSFVNFGAVFTMGRILFELRYYFDESFWYYRVFEMKISNSLVVKFFIALFLIF